MLCIYDTEGNALFTGTTREVKKYVRANKLTNVTYGKPKRTKKVDEVSTTQLSQEVIVEKDTGFFGSLFNS